MVAGQEDAGVEDEGRWRPVVGCEESTSVLLTALIGIGGLGVVAASIVIEVIGIRGRAGCPVPPFCSRSRASCSWLAQ